MSRGLRCVAYADVGLTDFCHYLRGSEGTQFRDTEEMYKEFTSH